MLLPRASTSVITVARGKAAAAAASESMRRTSSPATSSTTSLLFSSLKSKIQQRHNHLRSHQNLSLSTSSNFNKNKRLIQLHGGGGPRRVRYNLPNASVTARKRRGGGFGSSSSSSSTSGEIPTYFYWIGGIAAIGSVGMYIAYIDYAPLTRRRRWIATDPDFEKEMGDQNYQQMIQQQFLGKILPRHHPASRLIERVGSRIFAAAGDFAQKNGLDYFDTRNVTFTVVESDQANAFVLPGNHVFFLTGMFKYAQTEDEVGCILGHEMAHNLARHQGEKMSGSAVIGLLARLSLLFDPSGGFMMVFLPASQILAELPNSRTQETEADEIGMYLAAQACYDPSALGRVFARMDTAVQVGSDKNLALKPPEFLSTHPNDTSRIKNMKKWLPETNRIFHQDDGLRCRNLRRQIEMGNLIIKRTTKGGIDTDGLL